MLHEIHANGIGLQDKYDLCFGNRLNLFTGDNGLGKSFVLDLSWWSLTGHWYDKRAFPRTGYKGAPVLSAEISDSEGVRCSVKAEFEKQTQTWKLERRPNSGPDIVIYAGIDGGFAVWDKLRKDLAAKEQDNMPMFGSRPSARIDPVYRFNNQTLWDGLRDSETNRVRCKGLLQDLVDWQIRPSEIRNAGFAYMSSVLKTLSAKEEIMGLGEVTRLFVDDVREIPTIRLSYGDVPVILCSSAVQRIVGLAYLLVWSWKEHVEAAKIVGVQPGRELVLIMDELELHLHPKWQRQILLSILGVAGVLNEEIRTQVIATTHSPLVLASIEPHFNAVTDKLFLFETEGKPPTVVLKEEKWIKEGDAASWLTSEIFGLGEARSTEGERAIRAAQAFMRGDTSELPEGLTSREAIHKELRRVLGDDDEFWAEWIVATRKESR